MKTIALVILLLSVCGKSFSDQTSAQPFGEIPGGTLVGVWYFNEGAGTVTQDATGRSNGTLTSGPSWVKGLHGQALGFTASANRVQLSNPSRFDFMNLGSTWCFSILYNTGYSQPQGFMFTRGTNFSANGAWFFRGTSAAVGDFSLEIRNPAGVSKTYTNVIPASQSAAGKNHNIFVSYCATNSTGVRKANVKIWLDAVPLDLNVDYTEPDINIGTPAGAATTINGVDDGAQSATQGNFDEVAVWDRSGQLRHPSDGDVRAFVARRFGRF